jgi:hypothetical protein
MRFTSIAAGAALCCCAPPILAQSLTRVQILGLQQQLRDDGCGVTHITGRMDAMTKHAVRSCMQKYNVSSGGAEALLSAMNIGLGPNDPLPSLAATGQTNSTAIAGSTVGRMARRMGGRRHMHRTVPGQAGDSMPSSSSSMHQDSTTTPTVTPPSTPAP